jgi:GTP-binding protein
LPYRFRKAFKAAGGEAGMSREKYGKNAEDLILPVPVGTVIKDSGRDRIITTLDRPGARVVVAK